MVCSDFRTRQMGSADFELFSACFPLKPQAHPHFVSNLFIILNIFYKRLQRTSILRSTYGAVLDPAGYALKRQMSKTQKILKGFYQEGNNLTNLKIENITWSDGRFLFILNTSDFTFKN